MKFSVNTLLGLSPLAAGVVLISLVLAVSSMVLTCSTMSTAGAKPNDPASTTTNGNELLAGCIGSTLKILQPTKIDVGLYQQLWQLCGSQLDALDSLNDYAIRKEKFLRQELDERVILWMVVAITLSGIGLAALQLLASYRLASRRGSQLAEDSAISLARDRISLKSSVTGLVILVISLAFFIAYIVGVYTWREVAIQRPGSFQLVTPNSEAGLGPPSRSNQISTYLGQMASPLSSATPRRR